MSSDIISISPEEARTAVKTISDQSAIAQEAVQRVKNSPSLVPNWRGNRRQEFEERVVEDMQRLNEATKLIEDAATRVRTAMVELMRADGINV